MMTKQNEEVQISKDDIVEYIELQTSHVTQISKDGKKGNWLVKQNGTGKNLHTLPVMLSDQDVFNVMHFAKEYELKAFNSGIRFQKTKQNDFLTDKVEQLTEVIQALTEENERLSTVIDKFHAKH